jgi:hypothetical protein
MEREREFSKLRQAPVERTVARLPGSPDLGKTLLWSELRRELLSRQEPALYVPFRQPLHAFSAGMVAEFSLKCHINSSVTLRGVLWGRRWTCSPPLSILLRVCSGETCPFESNLMKHSNGDY